MTSSPYRLSPAANLAARLVLMVLGVTLVAAGISLSKISATGTSAISCIPAVVVDASAEWGHPLTLGTCTLVLNVIFIGVQIVLLRRLFHPIHLLQVPMVFLLAGAVDAWTPVFENLSLHTYAARLAAVLVSMVVLALGAYLEVTANLLMIPGEGVVVVIAHVLRRPFPRVKVIFDSTLIVSAACLSLLLFHRLVDVREGSILAAILVGPLIRMWGTLLGRFLRLPPLDGGIRPLVGE